ncbi:MAG TPA: hypothetical protein VGO50_05135 [Pyrinomonadaceae bacterium]|jgi:Tol biopolymer transport system component|nr:hypothetical protein [Pyrinomonadaceae bacterium]
MPTYPDIHWVTEGTDFKDYRPAIGGNGKSVIFERTFLNTSIKTKLYKVDSLSGDTPVPILPNLNTEQTRPDWCWKSGQVAFNRDNLIGIIKTAGQASFFRSTDNFFYPQWNADGSTLTVMNSSGSAGTVHPCSSVIDPKTGAVSILNINGNDADGTAVYGGMPAVKPHSTNHIAFAGQPALDNWSPGSGTSYDQKNNYIFLNSPDRTGHFPSSPAETDAPIDSYDPDFQGRAPAWSPDGNFIVFESTRNGNAFALFLLTLGRDRVPVQLTDTVYEAQHAKFFPGGKRLIFCAKPTPTSRNRIAWIDISDYV